MRKTALVLFLFCASFSIYGQGSNEMAPNRFSYISLGGGYPYVTARIAYEGTRNTYIEVQGLTDGGGVWKENVYNDWRSISLLKAFDLKPLSSEIRVGAGIVQTAERISQQRSNTFGMTPSLGFSSVIHPKWALYGSIYYPISPATTLTSGVSFGLEYRIGRYVKENGLYSRKGRPNF